MERLLLHVRVPGAFEIELDVSQGAYTDHISINEGLGSPVMSLCLHDFMKSIVGLMSPRLISGFVPRDLIL